MASTFLHSKGVIASQNIFSSTKWETFCYAEKYGKEMGNQTERLTCNFGKPFESCTKFMVFYLLVCFFVCLFVYLFSVLDIYFSFSSQFIFCVSQILCFLCCQFLVFSSQFLISSIQKDDIVAIIISSPSQSTESSGSTWVLKKTSLQWSKSVDHGKMCPIC